MIVVIVAEEDPAVVMMIVVEIDGTNRTRGGGILVMALASYSDGKTVMIEV